MNSMDNDFSKKLKRLMDEYVHFVYGITKKFSREEIYGVTSQIRRTALSVILNYIEGFTRQRKAVKKFLGDLKNQNIYYTLHLLKIIT